MAIIVSYILLGSPVKFSSKSPASNYHGFGASTSDSRRFSMKHRPEIGKFCFCCQMFDRKTWNCVERLNYITSIRDHTNKIWKSFSDFVCVVTNGCYVFYTSCCSLACHVSIADWFVPFNMGGNMLTCGILTRGIFWSDAPRLPSFNRTAHQYAKFKKKVTNWAGICWHVTCWHVADFDRTAHVYRAGTCHVEMIKCEKVRLPRQICIFCVSAVSRMESRFLFL